MMAAMAAPPAAQVTVIAARTAAEVTTLMTVPMAAQALMDSAVVTSGRSTTQQPNAAVRWSVAGCGGIKG